MKKPLAALAAILLLTGCSTPSAAPAEPPPAQSPPVQSPAPPEEPGTLPSSAAPGVAEGQVADAKAALEQLRHDLKDRRLEPGHDGQVELWSREPSYYFRCATAGKGNVPHILACRFGLAPNLVNGHALLWRAGDEFRAQLYPQAPAELAAARLTYFRGLGENCPIGCGSGFTALRAEENLLLAQINLSAAGTQVNEEIQLLKHEEATGWKVVWAPDPAVFKYEGNPRVTLPEVGLDSFSVFYADGSSAAWKREGERFVKQ